MSGHAILPYPHALHRHIAVHNKRTAFESAPLEVGTSRRRLPHISVAYVPPHVAAVAHAQSPLVALGACCRVLPLQLLPAHRNLLQTHWGRRVMVATNEAALRSGLLWLLCALLALPAGVHAHEGVISGDILAASCNIDATSQQQRRTLARCCGLQSTAASRAFAGGPMHMRAPGLTQLHTTPPPPSAQCWLNPPAQRW